MLFLGTLRQALDGESSHLLLAQRCVGVGDTATNAHTHTQAQAQRQTRQIPTMSAAHIYTHHIFVSGKVQGVFYRKHTALTAHKLGITGWVRNLPDSRVEIMAEGTAEQLSALETWCQQGSPKAAVTGVVVTDLTLAVAVAGESGEAQEEKEEVVLRVPHGTKRTSSTFEVRR